MGHTLYLKKILFRIPGDNQIQKLLAGVRYCAEIYLRGIRPCGNLFRQVVDPVDIHSEGSDTSGKLVTRGYLPPP
jgi:hypothetical protein